MVFFKMNIISDIRMTNAPTYYIEAVIRRAESVIKKIWINILTLFVSLTCKTNKSIKIHGILVIKQGPVSQTFSYS